jgi:glutamate N-acetyltransferase/amino-acid N-acetyltransferase
MVLCFATGAYTINEQDHEQMKAFQNLLNEACIDLAKQIAKDGEGATKLIEVHVKNAPRYSDAKQIAKQVIDSPLVKTAIHGEDPNWGRLIMAIGKNETIKLNPNKVHVMIGDKLIVENGLPTKIERAVLKKELKKNTILITVDCTIGKSNATAWGCDLTKGYIDINTDYN